MSSVLPDSVPIEPADGGLRRSPRRRSVRVPRPAAVQLPLFPEQVTLTRIRPELNERRFYQIEIMADLFGAVVLARRWGRIGRSCRMRLEPGVRTRKCILRTLDVNEAGTYDITLSSGIHRSRLLDPPESGTTQYQAK